MDDLGLAGISTDLHIVQVRFLPLYRPTAFDTGSKRRIVAGFAASAYRTDATPRGRRPRRSLIVNTRSGRARAVPPPRAVPRPHRDRARDSPRYGPSKALGLYNWLRIPR
jgi:hypothetical protein